MSDFKIKVQKRIINKNPCKEVTLDNRQFSQGDYLRMESFLKRANDELAERRDEYYRLVKQYTDLKVELEKCKKRGLWSRIFNTD